MQQDENLTDKKHKDITGQSNEKVGLAQDNSMLNDTQHSAMSSEDASIDNNKEKEEIPSYDSYAEEIAESDEEIGNWTKSKPRFQPIWLVYGFGALLLLYGGYNLLSGYFTRHAEAVKIKSQHDNTLSATSFKQPTMQPFDHDNKQKISTAALDNKLKALDQKTTIIEQKLVALTDRLDKNSKILESLVKDQHENLANLSSRLDEMSKQKSNINMIKEIMAKQSNQSLKLETIQNSISKLQLVKSSIINPLKLTAVTDEYAWLSDEKGRIFSVAPGEMLKGYGKVLKIDQKAKKVYLSSGYVFE